MSFSLVFEFEIRTLKIRAAEEVVKALDEAWLSVKGLAANYWH